MGEGLFVLDEVERRIGSRALVAVESSECPACGSGLKRVTSDEPVLFRHGGYGATRHSVTDHCTNIECHWALQREVTEVKP
jgi:hypothetical protein